MKKIIICSILLSLLSYDLYAEECDPVKAEKELTNILNNYNVPVTDMYISDSYYGKTICYNVDKLTPQQLLLIGDRFEDTPLGKEALNSNANVVILQRNYYDYDKKTMCKHVFVRILDRKNIKKPTDDEIYKQMAQNITKIENTLLMKKQQLAMLKKQQYNLNVENLDLYGDILIGVIPTSGIKILDGYIQKSAEDLKNMGITKISKYLDFQYIPSENATADKVRDILSPINEIINESHLDLGIFGKYWEALNLTPDAGMIIGNTAASVRIYFMERELKKEIKEWEQKLEDAKKAQQNYTNMR